MQALSLCAPCLILDFPKYNISHFLLKLCLPPFNPSSTCVLPSFKAFLYREYSKEVLPMLCWGAEMRTQLVAIKQGRHCWPCVLMRTRDPGTETRSMHHPSMGFGLLRRTDKRLLSVSVAPLVADWSCSLTGQPQA